MTFSGKLDGIRVDHDALENAAVGMKRIVDAIDGVLDDLVQDLRPLVDQWDGETKAAFHTCERVWNREMTDLKDILERSAQTVQQSNADFRSTDLRNAASFDF